MTQADLDLFLNRAQQKIASLSYDIAEKEQEGNDYTCEEELLEKLLYTTQTLGGCNDLSHDEVDFLMQKLTQEAELWIIPYLIGIFYDKADLYLGPVFGNSGPVAHNDTTGKQGGAPGEFYHLDLSDYNYIKALRFQPPTISFPAASFGSDEGAELGYSYNYVSNILIVPNGGSIQSIKVFKTTAGVENPTPILTTSSLSFQLNEPSLTSTVSYRLEVKYLNQAAALITTNTTRSVPFYIATYYGVGNAGLNETGIKSLTKLVVPIKNLSLLFSPNNNKVYFAELKSNVPSDRKVFDVALEYTFSFIKTDVTFTNGTATPLMRVYEMNSNLVPGAVTFTFKTS